MKYSWIVGTFKQQLYKFNSFIKMQKEQQNSDDVKMNNQVNKQFDKSNMFKRNEISFDFSVVMTNINENFKNIWDVVQSNQTQIMVIKQEMKKLNNNKEYINNIEENGKSNSEQIRNALKNNSNDGVSLNYSDQTNKKQKNLNIQAQNAYEYKNFGQMSQSEIFPKPLQSNQDKKQVKNQLKNHEQVQPASEMISNKILQLVQRMESLETQLSKQVGFTSRKFNQLNNQIQKNNSHIEKGIARINKTEFDVNKLRDQLSEYKLKKQSKLMRMSSKLEQSSGNNNSSQFNNYILDKIQELLKASHDYATKQQIQELNNNLQNSVRKMQESICDTITADELNNTVRIINRRIVESHKVNGLKAQTNIKNPQKLAVKQSQDQQKNKEQNLQGEEEQEGILLHVKVLQLEKGLKSLHSSLLQQIRSRQQYTRVQNQFHRDKDKRITQLSENQQKNVQRFSEHQIFIQQMNETYNKKISDIESEIIMTQESIEKIQNQLKVSKFTQQPTLNKSDIVGSSNQFTNTLSDPGKVIQLQNQVTMLKKKFNKLALKLQSMKEISPTNQDSNQREIQSLKIGLQKKCDWDSLKKTIGYIEERFKQIYDSYDEISALVKPESKDETTAAKRGWTCLCCDKNIKQFQGKLSEAKFTNVFPSRYESPRIGGYFKQKQSDRQYKMIYSSGKNKKNSLQHNASSLKSNSKDQLPVL